MNIYLAIIIGINVTVCVINLVQVYINNGKRQDLNTRMRDLETAIDAAHEIRQRRLDHVAYRPKLPKQEVAFDSTKDEKGFPLVSRRIKQNEE